MRFTNTAIAIPEYNHWTPCVASRRPLDFCTHVNGMEKYASYKTGLLSSGTSYLYGCLTALMELLMI